jgi:hypothetical protein
MLFYHSYSGLGVSSAVARQLSVYGYFCGLNARFYVRVGKKIKIVATVAVGGIKVCD